MKMSKANQRKINELINDLNVCAQLTGQKLKAGGDDFAYWAEQRKQAYENLTEALGIEQANRI